MSTVKQLEDYINEQAEAEMEKQLGWVRDTLFAKQGPAGLCIMDALHNLFCTYPKNYPIKESFLSLFRDTTCKGYDIFRERYREKFREVEIRKALSAFDDNIMKGGMK